MAKAKNVSGTGDEKPNCECGDWIEHWERNTELKVVGCSNTQCGNNKDIVGGHVFIDGGKTENIIPLCSFCNNSTNTEEMDIGNTLSFKVTLCNYTIRLNAIKKLTEPK